MKMLIIAWNVMPYSVGLWENIIVGIVRIFIVINVRIIGIQIPKPSKINHKKKEKSDFYEFFFLNFSPVQYRVCDYCNEKLSKDSKDSADPSRRATVSKKDETDDNVDLRFEVRPERLNQSQTNTWIVNAFLLFFFVQFLYFFIFFKYNYKLKSFLYK